MAARPVPAAKRWAWGGGLGAALAFAIALSRPAEQAPPPLPPELRGEPDVYIEAPVITQFGDDGAVRYRLTAREIHQFQRERLATIAAPALKLYPRDGGPPWDLTSATGALRAWGDAAGNPFAPTMGRPASEAEGAAPGAGAGGQVGDGPEAVAQARETLLLRDDVALSRDGPNGRFMTLKTSLLRVDPKRRRADTDQPVIIETTGGRTTAAAFEGDLERGWMRLFSTPSQRVEVLALPIRNGR